MSRIACPNCRQQFEVDKWQTDDTLTSCPDCGTAMRLGDCRVRSVGLKRVKKRHSAADSLMGFIVSFIVPGLGHVVKGNGKDAVIWFAISVACVVLAAIAISPAPALFVYFVMGMLSAFGSLTA